jgi:hypothetical protein
MMKFCGFGDAVGGILQHCRRSSSIELLQAEQCDGATVDGAVRRYTENILGIKYMQAAVLEKGPYRTWELEEGMRYRIPLVLMVPWQKEHLHKEFTMVEIYFFRIL